MLRAPTLCIIQKTIIYDHQTKCHIIQQKGNLLIYVIVLPALLRRVSLLECLINCHCKTCMDFFYILQNCYQFLLFKSNIKQEYLEYFHTFIVYYNFIYQLEYYLWKISVMDNEKHVYVHNWLLFCVFFS